MAQMFVNSREDKYCRSQGYCYQCLKDKFKNALATKTHLPNYQIVECPPGCADGEIWGTDFYTDDSSVCTMAVHEGITTAESGGTFAVIRFPCTESTFTASFKNGIQSRANTSGAPGAARVRKLVSCKEESRRKCPKFSKCEGDYICVPAIEGAQCDGKHCEDNKCVGTECTFIDVLSLGLYD